MMGVVQRSAAALSADTINYVGLQHSSSLAAGALCSIISAAVVYPSNISVTVAPYP